VTSGAIPEPLPGVTEEDGEGGVTLDAGGVEDVDVGNGAVDVVELGGVDRDVDDPGLPVRPDPFDVEGTDGTVPDDPFDVEGTDGTVPDDPADVDGPPLDVVGTDGGIGSLGLYTWTT